MMATGGEAIRKNDLEKEGGKMTQEESHRPIWIVLIAAVFSITLIACGSDSDNGNGDDNGDDNGDPSGNGEGSDHGIVIDGHEAMTSGVLDPDETDEYLATVPEDAEVVYATTEEVGHQYTLTLSRVDGGSSSRGGSGSHEASINNFGENEYRILVSNASDEEIEYELTVYLDPEDVEIELEEVDGDQSSAKAVTYASPTSNLENHFSAAGQQLPVIGDIINKAAIQTEERVVYDLHGEDRIIGDVTILVERGMAERQVRFYGRIEAEGTDQRFATHVDAPAVLDSETKHLLQGQFWVFAEGRISHGRMGHDTGTDSDVQLISKPGPMVKEVTLNELSSQHTLKAH
ncbi:hypothetical protein J2T60_001189 [Natronospira proteinivora]|uniref:Cadherin domain-containing protein n=1 Tax=Natronospira proteinivora TaxID=1807133 RepID=A0ABT1G7F3_9GAMM|nr:hypothetical protein [Natronospira proteinivora]MCP1727224.1 hypothetical protein [Natronospira proteinivora]